MQLLCSSTCARPRNHGTISMTILRPFNEYWLSYLSGDHAPLVATITFTQSGRAVGIARFWKDGEPVPLAADNGTVTTLHFRAAQLQHILSGLNVPRSHRVNFTDPANAGIDFGV